MLITAPYKLVWLVPHKRASYQSVSVSPSDYLAYDRTPTSQLAKKLYFAKATAAKPQQRTLVKILA